MWLIEQHHVNINVTDDTIFNLMVVVLLLLVVMALSIHQIVIISAVTEQWMQANHVIDERIVLTVNVLVDELLNEIDVTTQIQMIATTTDNKTTEKQE